MSDLVVATWNWDAFMRGFMASGGSVLIVVIAFGLVGAIASVVGLVRGVSNRQTTAIALGGVGIGCAIIGLLFFTLGLWTASAVCGLMACKRSKQPRTLTYEEFKQRKAMIQDPEYAEYMRMVHGVEDTSGGTMSPVEQQQRNVSGEKSTHDTSKEGSASTESTDNAESSKSSKRCTTITSSNDYIQASMRKNGGEVKPPMSDGKLVAIVLG